MTHFPKFSIIEDGVTIKVDLGEWDSAFQKAQYKLDSQIMNDMVPYMPLGDGMGSGTFIQETRARSASLAGSGQVCAAAGPFGRFLYMGKVMIYPPTGSPFAPRGEHKVVTNRYLRYCGLHNPDARAFWFEAAKKRHSDEWVWTVEQALKHGR